MIKKRIKKLISVLSCVLCLSTIPFPVYADSSVGSVKEDITNEVKVGQDTAQSKVVVIDMQLE